MNTMHDVAKKVFQEDPDFYSRRGVKVHSLEITRYQCADYSTSEILEQIIQETTNRMNKLSQQESENEVKMFKMQGQIEQEKLNSELVVIQNQHKQQEAQSAGQAEAEQVTAFMAAVAKEVPNLADRISIWQTLRKKEALS